MKRVRLNKCLAQFGVCSSRRSADALIKQGAVRINGQQVFDLATRVTIGEDKVVVNDMPISQSSAPLVYWLLYKPRRLLVSRQPEGNKQTIFSLKCLRKIRFPLKYVGRLDYMSEGLLLLTNDGQLAYRLSHPRFALEKQYVVLLDQKLTPEQLQTARGGELLPDGKINFFSINFQHRQFLGKSHGYWYRVTVREGRNRLLRRVFAALGLTVLRLIRITYAGLPFAADIEEGNYRQLTSAEIARLQRLAYKGEKT